MAVIFPRWTNKTPLIFLLLLAGGGTSAIFAVWYWFSPEFTDVGYAPKQPVPFSHKLHAGTLGLDCRFCHYSVEKASYAAIPHTDLCMSCHTMVRSDSRKLTVLKANYEANKPVPWVRVHLLPDYAFFDHSVHVGAGVGCASCHGKVDKMDVVYQVKPLSMSWCLNCHRDPNAHIRPKEQVTNMKWEGSAEQKKFQADLKSCLSDQKSCNDSYIRDFIARRRDIQTRRKDIVAGKTIKRHQFLNWKWPQEDPKQLFVNPPEHCSGCHR